MQQPANLGPLAAGSEALSTTLQVAKAIASRSWILHKWDESGTLVATKTSEHLEVNDINSLRPIILDSEKNIRHHHLLWQKHTNMMGWSHEYTKVTNKLTCASNLTDVWCIYIYIYNFVVNLLHEVTHEPTANFHWDANCTKKTWTYIGIDVNVSHQPDKLPKKPTVRHKNVISSSEKRSDKKSLVLTHPVGISPGFPPGFHLSFVPQHHGPRSGRLTPNHWVTNIASSAWLWNGLLGIQSGHYPQMCLKSDGPKKYPANSFRNGFPFQQTLGREKL